MTRARVERHWEEFRRTGHVRVGASVVKGILSSLAALVLTLFPALKAADAFGTHGAVSPTGWLCVLVAALFATGTVVALLPVLRGRRLDLTPDGLAVSARRSGRRVLELGLRWHEVHHVAFHHEVSASSSTEKVRIGLGRIAREGEPGIPSHSPVDLPDGFRMSKRDLAELMEGIRAGVMAQRRSTDARHG